MFPKGKRVKTKDFEAILADGWTANSTFIYSKYINGGLELKISSVVPKKVLTKAVKRIRLKRRINSILTSLSDTIPKGKYVFFAKKGLGDLDKDQLRQEIGLVLKQLNKN